MSIGIKLTIPRGATVASVESVVKPYWRWVAPFPPESVNPMVSLSRTQDQVKQLSFEWYKFSEMGDVLTPPWDMKGADMLQGPHGVKRRSDAKKRAVKAKDAKRSSDPTAPFEYVSVELGA